LLSTINYGKGKNKIKDFLTYNFLLILLILLAALRFRVGGDTLAYMDTFKDLPKLSDLPTFDFKEAQYDPLWYIFNALIKSIYDNFIFFQLIHAIIINTIIFWFIRKYSKFKYISILFYYIFYYLYFNMEILRESLAVCVFLLSVPYLLQKKWLIYFSISIVAFLFHSSALIAFFIPFMSRKLKFQYYILIFSLLTMFIFIKPYELFSMFTFSGRVDNRILLYTNLNVTIYGILMQLILIIPVMVLQRIRKINKLEIHKFEYLLTAYIVLGLLASVIGGFYRFLNYLSFISIIYIVDTITIIYKYRINYFKSFLKVQFVVFILLFHQGFYMFTDTSKFQLHTKFYNMYLPYYSVFDEHRDLQREKLYYNLMDITN
jgi:hypothetical protein